MGKCGTADTSVYFALSTLPLGRAAEEVELPSIAPDDFKYQWFDIRSFSGDFISSGFDFTFPVSYIKRAGTDISM